MAAPTLSGSTPKIFATCRLMSRMLAFGATSKTTVCRGLLVSSGTQKNLPLHFLVDGRARVRYKTGSNLIATFRSARQSTNSLTEKRARPTLPQSGQTNVLLY